MLKEPEFTLDYQQIFGDWYYPLKKSLFEDNNFYMSKLIEYLEKQYKNKTVCPYNKKDIFRAFRITPYRDVKVVILGQDPYPSRRATGLAFGNELKLTEEPSPSLQKIQDCIEKYFYDGFNLDFDPTLEPWAKQGVLLLNTALSVRKGEVGSHTKYWRRFMKLFLESMSESNTGIHYLLLGSQAKTFEKYIDKKNNHIYSYCHPAFSARIQRDWNCIHFKTINTIIEEQNGKEYCIKW